MILGRWGQFQSQLGPVALGLGLALAFALMTSYSPTESLWRIKASSILSYYELSLDLGFLIDCVFFTKF
jgi:hypothetical protein